MFADKGEATAVSFRQNGKCISNVRCVSIVFGSAATHARAHLHNAAPRTIVWLFEGKFGREFGDHRKFELGIFPAFRHRYLSANVRGCAPTTKRVKMVMGVHKPFDLPCPRL